MDPFITILIPTINRLKYLKDSLNSALSQTFTNIQIIVSNNCSTDSTKEYLNTIIDNRVTIIHHEKTIEMIDHWNTCINYAKGEYIVLLSDDDLLDDNFVEKIYRIRETVKKEKNEIFPIIYTNYRIINTGGDILESRININTPVIETGEEFIKYWLRGKRKVTFCSTLYHTDSFKKIKGFTKENPYAADAIARGILALNNNVLCISEALCSYRIHEKNLTNDYNIERRFKSNLDMVHRILAYTNDNPHRKEIKTYGLRYARRLFIVEASESVINFHKIYARYLHSNTGKIFDLFEFFLRIFRGHIIIKKIKGIIKGRKL